MLEVIVVVIIALVAIGFLLVRRGKKLRAEPSPAHLPCLQEMNEEELGLAYNETVTGIGLAGTYGWSESRIRSEVEIAVSLRALLARSSGKDWTTGDKGKLRMELTKAAMKSRQENKQKPSFHVMSDHLLVDPFEDVEDRSRLDDAMLKLRRSV